MRRAPLLLTPFLLQPLLRLSPALVAATTPRRLAAATSLAISTRPALSYPVCVRNFTCAAPWKQDFHTIMSDLKKEEGELAEAAAAAAAAEAAPDSSLDECEKLKEQALKAKEEAKGAKKEEAAVEEPKLPKLSASDFRAYNSMAEHMEYFHNHFRQTWNLLYTACTTGQRPARMSLGQFISTGLQFTSHLNAHHSIEEQHIFPVLAQRMPEFKAGRNAAELLRQHKEIHRGMDQFEEYLTKCRRGEADFQLSVLKEKMDSWGEVLWKHLEQEVKTLGAENMRKYWSLDDMRRMPM